MTMWLYLAMPLLLVLSGALLLWESFRSQGPDHKTQRRFNDLLKRGVISGGADEGWILSAIERMGGSGVGRLFSGSDQEEMTRLLKQAGWYAARKRTAFILASWLSPLLVMACAVVYSVTAGDTGTAQKLALVFVAFALGFLSPRYILRYRANARRSALSREMPTAIYLLRMLFDADLSTEHALRVMHEEGHVLMPNLSEELAGTLQRIEAGHDRSDALSDMAAPLEVAELTDTVAILKQVTRHGGNIRDSLAKFAELIGERQQSALREYVNRLLGLIAGRYNKIPEAIDYLQKAEGELPIDVRVRNDLGYALLLGGQFDSARNEFLTALELDGSDRLAATNMLLLLSVTGGDKGNPCLRKTHEYKSGNCETAPRSS